MQDRHEERLVSSAEQLRRFAETGARSHFDAFVRREQAALLRFVRTLVADEGHAEEVFQEAFLAAFRHAGTFRGESARAWLFTIARHAAQRLGRRRAGEPAGFDDLAGLGGQAGWGASDATALHPVSPEDAAAHAEWRRILTTALATLSADDQEILLLRDVEGLSGPEAAEVLGCTPNNAKMKLHRARLRLMAALRGARSTADG